jgi:Tfp pilus assembly PilM family ATPase
MFGSCRKGWIGIEWGAQTLKLAQVERSRGAWRIAASAVLERKSAAAVPVWSAQELRSAIRSDSRFSGRRVACALPMQLTELRQLTIPPGSAAERYAMVANEIASAQVEAGADVVFDFWESEGGETPQTAETVNAMSVPCGTVAEVTRILTQAGLECEVLDGFPFSLGRAVGLTFGQGSTPIAVLDWGRASSTFCLIRHGLPLFTRHLPYCGLAKLLETVGQSLALPEKDVTEALATYGLPGESTADGNAAEIQAVIAEAAQPLLQELVEELRRTFAFLGTQYAGANPERLCLTGEGATVKHADHFLGSQIAVPVNIWAMPAMASGDAGLPAVPMPQLAAAVALSILAWPHYVG